MAWTASIVDLAISNATARALGIEFIPILLCKNRSYSSYWCPKNDEIDEFRDCFEEINNNKVYWS